MPQLLLSVSRSRQTPEQFMVPAPQVTEHTPEEHTWPDAHPTPQAPQLLLSVWRSLHTPEQLVVPAVHDTAQAREEQT